MIASFEERDGLSKIGFPSLRSLRALCLRIFLRGLLWKQNSGDQDFFSQLALSVDRVDYLHELNPLTRAVHCWFIAADREKKVPILLREFVGAKCVSTQILDLDLTLHQISFLIFEERESRRTSIRINVEDIGDLQ